MKGCHFTRLVFWMLCIDLRRPSWRPEIRFKIDNKPISVCTIPLIRCSKKNMSTPHFCRLIFHIFICKPFPSNFLWFYSSYTWGYPTLLCFLPRFLSPVPIPGMIYRQRGSNWRQRWTLTSQTAHWLGPRGRINQQLIFGYCMVVTPGRLLISAFVVVFGY